MKKRWVMTREKKQKILLLIPLAMITCLLIYSWITFVFTDIIATWRHYSALVLFAVLVYIYLKSFTKAIIATCVYLLLASFNVLSITPEIVTSWFRIGSIETPHFQALSLMLLVLFLILNFDTMFNMYYDYKEEKHQPKD